MMPFVFAADDAEMRADASTALDVIASRPMGSDGKPFWRPSRVVRLQQLDALGPLLPSWVTSRWILAQAQQTLHPALRRAHSRAMSRAVALRGGAENLPGVDEVDAHARLVDHDWAYRQLVLYEYGGLESYLHHVASADLIAGADRIREWARSPMRALQFIERSGCDLHWIDLTTGDRVVTINLGSTVLVLPGECVLGRVVPVEQGFIFDVLPLLVPEEVAAEVAHDPLDWTAVLDGQQHRLSEELRGFSLLHDVPDLIWQLATVDFLDPRPESIGVRDVMVGAERMFRAALADRLYEPSEVTEDALDRESCLAAALVHPLVLGRLDDIVGPDDAEALRALADRLSGPAADLCRHLALPRRDEAA